MRLPSNMVDLKAATTLPRPAVRIIGTIDHPDFRDADELLRADADLSHDGPPELIVIAQVRPGVVDARRVEQLRCEAPLAGMVALAGSWCEGETRTGRPLAGVLRLYWHEFAAWWRRQNERRAIGLCPEWLRTSDVGFRNSDFGFNQKSIRNPQSAIRNSGIVALAVPRWETADALADVFQSAGYATVWQPPAQMSAIMRGVTGGVWEGGQLDEREVHDLTRFCRWLSRASAPVVAILDFPRRDSCDRAIEAGAAAVLGKPWLNEELFETLRHARQHSKVAPREFVPARAA